MPRAFVTAGAAGSRTRLRHRAQNVEIGGGLPRQDAPGRAADVAAVKTEPNAASQLLHVGLSETCVGAARADGRALDALVDAAREDVAVEPRGLRVGLHHLANAHVCWRILTGFSRPCSATRSSASVR
jgi:hypothetical protein